MSRPFKLRYGLVEAERPHRHSYSPHLFSIDGPYGVALQELDGSVAAPAERASSEDDLWGLKLTTIHSCEEAKRWLERDRRGEHDYWTARVHRDDEVVKHRSSAVRALDELIVCDSAAAYDLRHAFCDALYRLVDEPRDLDCVVPDQNHPEGGHRYRVDGRSRYFIESQFAMRKMLGEFDRFLDIARQQLAEDTVKREQPWHQVGALRFSPPLSRRSRAGMRKAGDMSLGVAVAGLGATLSMWFRYYSAGMGVRNVYAGTTMPTVGRPHWELVASFVNAAFELTEQETGETLRQRWHALSRDREIRIFNWPELGVREAQVLAE